MSEDLTARVPGPEARAEAAMRAPATPGPEDPRTEPGETQRAHDKEGG
jgi:hypothetical protein